MIFVALGLWISGLLGSSPIPGLEWIGWISIALFSFFGLIGLVRLVDRGPQIVISDQGVFYKLWSDATIPWEAIRSIKERCVRGQQFLILELIDPSDYRPTHFLGRLAVLNKLVGEQGFALSAVGTDKNYAELYRAVSQFWKFSSAD